MESKDFLIAGETAGIQEWGSRDNPEALSLGNVTFVRMTKGKKRRVIVIVVIIPQKEESEE